MRTIHTLIMKNLKSIYKLKCFRTISANAGVLSNFVFLNKNEANFIVSAHYLAKRNLAITFHLLNRKEHKFKTPTGTLNNYLACCTYLMKKDCKCSYMFEQSGPDHQPTHTCILHLSGPIFKKFTGHSISKKLAQSEASHQALMDLYSAKLIDSSGKPLELTKKSSPSKILELLRKEIPLFLPEDFISKAEELTHQFDKEVAPTLLRSKEEDSEDGERKAVTVSYLDIMTSRLCDAPPSPDSTRNEEMLSHLALMEGKKARYSYLISHSREELLNAINENPVTIIDGGTGCGKSTQVPQMILNDWIKKGKGSECNVVVAQPRRLATLSVASWVAYERGEQLGESVGYKMRLDEQFMQERGGIMFYTCGSLREFIKNNPSLEGVSHVIIDEVHERSVDIDLLLLTVKLELQRAKESSSSTFRLVLMSATARVDALKAYFNTNSVVSVQKGRPFPVVTFYVDEIIGEMRQSRDDLKVPDMRKEQNRIVPAISHEFVVDVVRFIHKTKPEGAVLVFLPGWNDIVVVEKDLVSDADLLVLPLHSKLSRKAQERIFDRNSEGRRKVILATNIAETSLTVDDVVYVVDSGLQNDIRFDPTKNITAFSPVWIAKANAEQRIGRAGRLQPGEAFRLYDKRTYDQFEDFPQPEMQKLPLDWVVLRCKFLFEDCDLRGLLERVIEAPSSPAVEAAIKSLIHLRMLHFEVTGKDNRECLTPLGRAVCNLSIGPALAKAMIYSLFFGYQDLTLNFVALENKPELIFDAKVTASELRRMKAMWHSESDLFAMCALLSKVELALDRCELLRKDELDLDMEEFERVVSVKGIKRIVDKMDVDVMEPLNHISWERYEFFIRLKTLLERQMVCYLPKLHTDTFEQYSFGSGASAVRERECEVAISPWSPHSDLILSCFLSATVSIIREIIIDNRTSFRVVENGKKLSPRRSSVLSQCPFMDEGLFFSTDMFFWKGRNSFVAGDLSAVSPLSVALFYGQELELIPKEDESDSNSDSDQKCLLRIRGTQVSFIAHERTAMCLLNLRKTFQNVIDYYVEPHSVDEDIGRQNAHIEDVALKLKDLIRDYGRGEREPAGFLE